MATKGSITVVGAFGVVEHNVDTRIAGSAEFYGSWRYADFTKFTH